MVEREREGGLDGEVGVILQVLWSCVGGSERREGLPRTAAREDGENSLSGNGSGYVCLREDVAVELLRFTHYCPIRPPAIRQ